MRNFREENFVICNFALNIFNIYQLQPWRITKSVATFLKKKKEDCFDFTVFKKVLTIHPIKVGIFLMTQIIFTF